MYTSDLKLQFAATGIASEKTTAVVTSVPAIVPTEPAARLEGLLEQMSEQQRKAMESLAGGGSVMDASLTSGAARATIYRWLRGDPAFMEVYAMWQTQRRKNTMARLRLMSDKAADVVERKLDEGNMTASIQLLKGLGLLGGNSKGRRAGRRSSSAGQSE